MRRTVPMRCPLMRGAGRVLVLVPNNRDRLERIRPFGSDQQALQHDLRAVGDDFWAVVRRERTAEH